MKAQPILTSVLLAALSLGCFDSRAFCNVVKFRFTRVADTSTIIPAGLWAGQRFSAFTASGIDMPPGIDNGKVVFLGKPASGYRNGVFKWVDGVIDLVADPSTPRPGGGSFDYFHSPSVQGGEYAFSAYDGIYRTVRGVLTTVHGPSSFRASSRPSLDGSKVWFFAETNTGEGVYRWDSGSITCVAAKGQATPGAPGYSFNSLNSNVAGGQGKVAFYSYSGPSPPRRGIYKFADGSLQRVADNTMSAPGDGAGAFNGFLNFPIAYDGETLGFVASDSIRGFGLYLERDGKLESIAVNRQAAPGGGTFSITGYDNIGVSTDAGHVAFSSTLSEGSAIYTDLGGSLKRVVGTGDILLGQTVQYVELGVEGLSGKQIAFFARFTNRNAGIFVATVPEPSALLLSAIAMMGLLACAWRRAHRT